MGQRYNQITIEERFEIARLRFSGSSIRQIAPTLDREPSTIARELKRNGSKQSGYLPVYAEQQSRARRWAGSKLDRNRSLRDMVLSRLADGWSPETVAARLNRDSGTQIISYETIYRFVYAQIARRKDYSWRHLLPHGKYKRGWYGVRGGQPGLVYPFAMPG